MGLLMMSSRLGRGIPVAFSWRAAPWRLRHRLLPFLDVCHRQRPQRLLEGFSVERVFQPVRHRSPLRLRSAGDALAGVIRLKLRAALFLALEDGQAHAVVDKWRADKLARGLRHTAITAALDAFNGDYRKTRAFSRHASLDTVRRYDDNRADHAGQVAYALDAILG
jgi:hypothetical protein